jgi:hypothetical protein
MLGIMIWLDGEAVEVTGIISPENAVVSTTPSPEHSHNNRVPFSFKKGVKSIEWFGKCPVNPGLQIIIDGD